VGTTERFDGRDPDVKEILIIRWKSIGDVAFTLPAVNRIRDNFPDARLTFLVSKENAFVVEGFEAVDRIWTVDRGALKEGRYLAGVSSFLGLLRQIRRERFDLVVDFQAYGETALMARISGARERWGNAKPTFRSRAYTRNYDLGRERTTHPAMRHLAMLEAFGLRATPMRNVHRLDARHRDEARGHLDREGVSPGAPLVYFQPCTSAVAKNWPMDRYLAVARWLRERGFASVFGGGPSESAVLAQAKAAGFVVSTGLGVRGCVGLMAEASLVVGGDTGLVHIANSLGRRVLMIARPTAPRPIGREESVLLSEDTDVTRVPVADVIRQVAAILKIEV
jgi:ADP-heptose:LPS heptosyltransferase